jgi:hypothetical protein
MLPSEKERDDPSHDDAVTDVQNSAHGVACHEDAIRALVKRRELD